MVVAYRILLSAQGPFGFNWVIELIGTRLRRINEVLCRVCRVLEGMIKLTLTNSFHELQFISVQQSFKLNLIEHIIGMFYLSV